MQLNKAQSPMTLSIITMDGTLDSYIYFLLILIYY